MKRLILLLSLLSMLVLAGCVGGSRGLGSGVYTEVLNMHEVRDVYFSYSSEFEPAGDPAEISRIEAEIARVEQLAMFDASSGDWAGELRVLQQELRDAKNLPNSVDLSLSDEADFIEVFRLSTLVHNAGYADSLVAMYITGFDPNLIAVEPTGPYVSNNEISNCFSDVSLIDGVDYKLYTYCEAIDDVYVGGGIAGDITQGIDRIRLDLLNLPLDRLADNIVGIFREEEFNFFESTGLFSNFVGGCEASRETGDGYFDIFNGDIKCEWAFNFAYDVINRASRGSLLVAQYGGLLRDCKNGCVLVPAKFLPQHYISGNSELYPGGEALYVDYKVYLDRARWPVNLNDHNQLFQVSTCYLYTTYVTPTVCIDPTPQIADGDACRPGSITFDTQPAPLKVSRIEQYSQGPRVVFTIYVEDVMGGRAFHPGAVDYCSPATPSAYQREVMDTAKVIDARVLGSLRKLECHNEGIIHLVDGRGQTVCHYDLDPLALRSGAYQSTFNFEIGYLYRDTQTFTTSFHRI